MAKYAVIVVDMLNDFVTGALACDRGKAIVPAVKKLCNAAREKGVPVIFSNDCHIKGVLGRSRHRGNKRSRGYSRA